MQQEENIMQQKKCLPLKKKQITIQLEKNTAFN